MYFAKEIDLGGPWVHEGGQHKGRRYGRLTAKFHDPDTGNKRPNRLFNSFL